MKVVAHSLFVGAMTAWRAVAFATMAIALSLGQGLWAQGPLTLEAIALADSGNLSEAENVLRAICWMSKSKSETLRLVNPWLPRNISASTRQFRRT